VIVEREIELEQLTHTHVHWPDTHHRHVHWQMHECIHYCESPSYKLR